MHRFMQNEIQEHGGYVNDIGNTSIKSKLNNFRLIKQSSHQAHLDITLKVSKDRMHVQVMDIIYYQFGIKMPFKSSCNLLDRAI